MKYKKILATVGSVLMLGATMAGAFAAAYPASMNAGNTVVVQGTGAGASDTLALNLIDGDLSAGAVGTSAPVSVDGGDSVKLERSADKFNLGDAATTVFVTSLGKSHMPDLLAEGTYRDNDNDEFKFTQKIDLAGWSLTSFRDTDYADEAAVGVALSSGAGVLNYTLDFTKAPTYTAAKMENTNLKMFDKEYFVLDITSTTITLLDSATTTTMSGDESKSVKVNGKDYTIEVVTVGSNNVRLAVNGEQTNSLAQGNTYKLSDGTYVGIKDLVVASRESDSHFIEVSIGSGKLILSNENEVEMNDEAVAGLVSHHTNSSGVLNDIVLEWKTDDKEFITPTSELTMPGFGNVKVSMTGMNYPNEEVVKVENDGSDSIKLIAPIKSGTASFNLLYGNATQILGLGKDSSNKLVTASSGPLIFNETANDKWFVVSWNTSTESESYLLSAKAVTKDSANRTSIKNEVTGETICSDLAAAATCAVGNSVLTVNEVYREGSNKWVNVSVGGGSSFNTLYTVEGMAIALPYYAPNTTTTSGAINLTFENTTVGHNATSWYLDMSEENKDSTLAAGNTSRFTISRNSDNKLHVSAVTQAGSEMRVGDSDKYEYHVVSDLATRILHDRSGNQYVATVTYSGDQAYADIYVASESATTQPGEAGTLIVTDTEAASMTNKNMIVVGGSAINSMAATLLGVSYPTYGEAFTAETDVGAGEYLIQSFENGEDNVAVLVAGYNAEDTVKGATYLVNQNPDVAVNTKWIGSTDSAASSVAIAA
jgi:hypothetical protein